MSFTMTRAREILGDNIPPTPSRYAATASPSGPIRANEAGASARKQPPAQTRRHAARQPVPKSRSSSGIPSTEQGYDGFASHGSGTTTFQQGRVCSNKSYLTKHVAKSRSSKSVVCHHHPLLKWGVPCSAIQSFECSTKAIRI